MNKLKDVTFTPDDIKSLFAFGEQIREIRENISKGNAIAAMAVEAIQNGIYIGVRFTDETVLETIKAIYDYVYNVETIATELEEKFGEMYSGKRSICYGEERVAA